MFGGKTSITFLINAVTTEVTVNGYLPHYLVFLSFSPFLNFLIAWLQTASIHTGCRNMQGDHAKNYTNKCEHTIFSFSKLLVSAGVNSTQRRQKSK